MHTSIYLICILFIDGPLIIYCFFISLCSGEEEGRSSEHRQEEEP
jgi:hypothetical protein